MTESRLITLFFSWLAAVLGVYLFYSELNYALWIAFFVVDALLLAGAVLYAILTVRALRQGKTKWFGAASLTLLLIVIYLFGFTSLGRELGIYSRLWRNESRYMNQVSRIMATGSKEEKAAFTYPTVIDEGPPVRVAFSWGGIIDNWSGIVYDPTGAVLKANLFESDWSNWNNPELQPVRGLFGGAMRSALHLWGPWYFCTFT